MNQIEYRTGNLFDAPADTLLVHACNAQGVWGSGIAAQFKELFPEAFQYYKEVCDENRHDNIVGHVILFRNVGCMITSWGYGAHVSPPQLILKATREAFRQLLLSLEYEGIASYKEIHMPQINSGLFRVPWEQTECILNEVLKDFPDQKVVVWSQS